MKFFARIIKLGWSLLAVLITGMIIHLVFSYFPPDFAEGFLKGKQTLFQGIYAPAFYLHVIGAPLAILLGTIQAMGRYHAKWPRLHQRLGRAYVGIILFAAGPGGMVMAFYAKGGLWGKTSFLLLSGLWLMSTFLGYLAILRRDFSRHRNWMYRSYVLACSAIWLRIGMFIGHSMGSVVAQLVAHRRRPRALVGLAGAAPANLFVLAPAPVRVFLRQLLTWGFWRKPHRPSWAAARWGILQLLPETAARELHESLVYESGRALFELGFGFADSRRAAIRG